jgi:hypothetical protein
MTNGAMGIAPFGEAFADEFGVFLQLQRVGEGRCAASSRSVPSTVGLAIDMLHT